MLGLSAGPEWAANRAESIVPRQFCYPTSGGLSSCGHVLLLASHRASSCLACKELGNCIAMASTRERYERFLRRAGVGEAQDWAVSQAVLVLRQEPGTGSMATATILHAARCVRESVLVKQRVHNRISKCLL